MSQNASILAALKRGPLTPLYALQQLGVMRLAARVYELRQAGYPITSRKRELLSGKKVAEYSLDAKRTRR